MQSRGGSLHTNVLALQYCTYNTNIFIRTARLKIWIYEFKNCCVKFKDHVKKMKQN
jgi:hypothetical protein